MKKKLVTYYIIFLLAALFSITIITALFLVHMKQNNQLKILSAEQIIIFPQERTITPFTLTTDHDQIITNKNLLNHWTLLFFGFTHCSSICPATLSMMQHIYPTLHTLYPQLQFIFVSLDTERDTATAVAHYVHEYDADFIGTMAPLDVLHRLQSQFGIYSMRDEMSGDQLQHTPTIMFLNPRGNWVGVIHNPLPPKQFIQAIKDSIDYLYHVS